MTRVRLKRRVLLSAQVRTALTIAGSDSGGGAGIQADLKSFASIGVHGTSVITCVTAQNTRAVDSIFAIPTAEIRKQLRAVLDDFDVRAAKTGMLYSAGIVRAVANGLRRTSFPLVVDPVMIATVGARLEKDDFQAALVDRLFDRAALVTPNRYEAERLSGLPIRDVTSMEAAARAIRRLGPQAVLVKGGHLKAPSSMCSSTASGWSASEADDTERRSTARAARSRPRPRRTSPSGTRSSSPFGGPAGKSPRGSGPRTGRVTVSRLSIPKSPGVDRKDLSFVCDGSFGSSTLSKRRGSPQNFK